MELVQQQNAQHERGFSKTERLTATAGLMLFGAGSFVVGFFEPTKAGFFPTCPLLDLTGFACPGCGLTRGFHALFHGDVVAALDFNALIPFFALAFTYIVLMLASISLRGRTLKYELFTPTTLWAFTILAGVFVVLRNIPVYPLNVLFP